MAVGHITRSGQISVPKELLKELKFKAGDSVEVQAGSDGSIHLFRKPLKAADIAGMLKSNIRSTVEEMDEAVAEAFRKGEI